MRGTPCEELQLTDSVFAEAYVHIGASEELCNIVRLSAVVTRTYDMTARPVNRTILGSGGQIGIGESLMLQEKTRYEECE